MTQQRQILAFAIGLIVCCLTGIGVVVLQQLARLSANDTGIRRAQTVMSAVDSLHTGLRDAELSLHSFLQSGRRSELHGFRRAVDAFEVRLQGMERVLADRPDQVQKLATCRRVAAAYRDVLARVTASGNADRFDGGRRLLAAAEWTAAPDAAVLLSEMSTEARDAIDARRQQLLADAWTMQQLVLLSLALVAFGGVLVTMQVRREVKLRRESEERVRAALVRVDQRVQERTQALMDANRRLERALEERAEALSREQLARAAAERASELKDRFLATVSHELRTPLNAIVGWIQVLRTGALPPSNLERAIEAIDRNVRTQVRLIDDLLDVSHMAQGRLILGRTAVDFAAVVDRAVAEMRPAIDAKGVTLDYTPSEAIRLQGDQRRLQQIVIHLLMNALKFTPRGGRIEVRLSAHAERAELIVRDSGEGIDTEALPYVFEPFFQAPSMVMRSGLGLGLAIVREVVELHGGAVRAASGGAHGGAEFTVHLPLAAARAREAGGEQLRRARREASGRVARRSWWQRLRRRVSSRPD